MSSGHGSSAGCEDDFEGSQGSGFFWVLLVLDAARLSLRVLCMICRIRWWQWVQPTLLGWCGEHDFDGHVVEFENLQLAALAEFGYFALY